MVEQPFMKIYSLMEKFNNFQKKFCEKTAVFVAMI